MENNAVKTNKDKQPLLKNTIIFGIGTFFTKIISIIMVPLYTFMLSTAEYGTIDVLSTTAFLIIPIFTLAISESVLRFSLSKDANHKQIFTTGFVITFAGMIVMILSLFVVSRFIYTEFAICTLLFYAMEMFVPFLQHFMKAIGKTIQFVISSAIYALFSTTFILIFLGVFNLSISGYMFGSAVGVACLLVFSVVSCKLWRYFSIKELEKRCFRDMVWYSIPLIASNISHWVISASDVYVTKIIMGEEANGVLAVVRKIPSLISMIYTVFNTAFSLNSIADHNFIENGEESEKCFYEKNFNRLIAVICVALSIISLVIKPVSKLIFSEEFYMAWQFVPIYIIGVGIGCIGNYLEVIFKIVKKSKTIMFCSLISAVVNLIICIILMKFTPLGLYATGISTLVCRIVLFILYFLLSKKYISIKIDLKIWVSIILIIVQGVISTFLINQIIFFWIIHSVIFAILLIINFRYLVDIIKTIYKQIGLRN